MAKPRSSNRSWRLASTVAVAAVAIVAFASLGGVGLAQSAIGLAQYQYGKKVTICHKGKKEISVSVRAWPAHKRHGDTEGACVGTAENKHGSKAESAKHDGAKENGRAKEASEHAASSDRSDDDSGKGKGKSKGKGKGNGNGRP